MTDRELNAVVLRRAMQPLAIFSGLLLLCSCATSQPPLPADVPMNKEAGRGGWLIAMV